MALRLSFSLIVISISALIGCQPGLEQPYEINKLRILAIKADSPQIKVDLSSKIPVFTPDKINFKILKADPDSVCKEGNFQERLFVCIPQQYEDDSSYSLDCEGPNGIPVSGLSLSPMQFFLELMNRYKDIGQSNLPVDVILKGDKIKFPISIMAKVSNGKEESSAVKFVDFINYDMDNRNPVIQRLLIDNVDVTESGYRFALVANRRYKITPIIDKRSLDKIFYEVDNRYEDEGIQFSFFAQKGKFDKVATSDKYPDVEYTTPPSDKEEYTAIYIVARDFRGGIDFIEINCIKILPEMKE
ncbi:MAG: hypothetical protein ACP5QK_01385 [Myxococcota bacterium]